VYGARFINFFSLTPRTLRRTCWKSDLRHYKQDTSTIAIFRSRGGGGCQLRGESAHPGLDWIRFRRSV